MDTRLSYSSATLLKNCEMRYWHYKVNETPVDSDFEQNNEAFDIGSAFHEILELTNHRFTEDFYSQVVAACEKFNVVEHQALIHAMALKYLKLHAITKLEAVHCELCLSNPEFVGFADVILADSEKNWWIVDLKTATRFNDLTLARLTKDTQLNLYSHFAPMIAKTLKLDLKKFKGARYRATTKYKLKQKKTESYEDFVRRLFKGVRSYDVVIPKELMTPKETYETHMQLHKVSMELRGGEREPTKNRSYCDSFFKACPYWSQCYGKTKTDLIGQTSVYEV